MSKFAGNRISLESGLFVKTFGDTTSYQAELAALTCLRDKGISPGIIDHDSTTQTLKIANAGSSLESIRRDQEHVFSMSQIHRFSKELMKALSVLHSENLCHYDLKEANICIAPNSDNGTTVDLDRDFSVTLIDFGLSFNLDEIPSSYIGNTNLGTPVCRSPEHLDGCPQYGQAADVFCAAATIVQLIKDEPEPFSLCYGKLDAQIRSAQELVNPGYELKSASKEVVPRDLTMLLYAMLHPSPLDRPTSQMCFNLL